MRQLRATARQGALWPCVIAGVLAVACGSNGPTAPVAPPPAPPSTLQIPTGRAGFDISSDEGTCTAKTPAWGFGRPRALSSVMVAADGGGWIARSESDRYGDIEVRLTLTPTNQTEASVTGAVRGTAIDLFSILNFPNPSQVAVTGAAADEGAALSGTYFGQLRGAFGTIQGTLVYTDNQRGVMTCTGANWFLFPGPP